MGGNIYSMAGSLGGAAIGAGANVIGGFVSNALAAEREAQAREENYRYGEMAAGAADLRTRNLYRDLYSPEAQIKQLKEAGLSPSLMYQNANGISGQSGAQGTGSGNVIPSVFGINPMEGVKVGLAMAEARLKNAEADKIEGKNERGKAEIAEIWAKEGAEKAATSYTNAHTAWQNLQNEIGNETKTASIWKIKSEASKAADEATKAFYEAENEGLEWRFNMDSYNERLEILAAEGAKLIAEESYIKTKQKLTQQEISNLKEELKYIGLDATAHAYSANAYGNYVDAYCENLPKQLELRNKEINLKKWEIGVESFNNIVRTIGYMAGASQLGEGGYDMSDTEVTTEYDKDGNKGRTTTRSRSTTKKPMNKTKPRKSPHVIIH